MKQIFCSLPVSAWPPPPPLHSPKMLADKIIAVVGNKAILKSDIDNSLVDMQRQGRTSANAACMTLEQTLGVKALVLQAEKIPSSLQMKNWKQISTTRSVISSTNTDQKKNWKKLPAKPFTSLKKILKTVSATGNSLHP